MTQRRVNSWWEQWTCVGGTCAPDAAAPRNRFDRILDAYTDATAPFLRGCYVFATVAVAALVTSALGPVSGLLLEAAFFLVAGTYCLANFYRCREAHCIVTGTLWTALAVAGLVAALAGRDVRSAEWVAFVAIALTAYGFEALWKAARGTNALRLGEPQPAPPR